MSKLDRLKEEIGYQKYWQGIMVVTEISLIGWLLTSGDDAPISTFALAAAGIVGLSCTVFALHRLIALRMERIEEL